MNRSNPPINQPVDVAIIGGGPAGLAAAMELKRRGVEHVVVLERETRAGGIPRHCGHPPFGMREFRQILTGPRYARKLVQAASTAGVDIRTSTTVIEARKNAELLITTDKGLQTLLARRVIHATGVRETPRSARLISGMRPSGVLNTGALQSMVYLKAMRPFENPVIIGSELVAFSAIKTCRHGKIRPVAMIENARQPTARWPVPLYARISGIALHLGTRLVGIEGKDRVSSVVLEEQDGEQRRMVCDGVLLTGKFTPESSLARCGHLAIDPATGGPVVDTLGRCSDPAYFAAGNVLRPVETAGWSWNEGRNTGRRVADDLAGRLASSQANIPVTFSGPLIKFVMPQEIALPVSQAGMQNLQLRFHARAKGILKAISGNKVIWRKAMSVYPERRVLIPVAPLAGRCAGGQIELRFESPVS
jgi:thioredoxin reductase